MLLEVKQLNAGYKGKQVLKELSFSVENHEIVGVLGMNGCGKTTLLRALCGLLPSRGSVRLKGRDAAGMTSGQRARVSRYIPQRSGIGLEISAMDVVLMGFNPELKLLESPGPSMYKEAARMLERVGMGERAEDDFQQLSEGQKQLCILARTLLLKSGILLMDEPESSLDLRGRYRLMELVRQWTEERDGCALVTLHDPQLALNTCDRLILIRDGMIHGECYPGKETAEETEKKMSAVFGALSLHPCRDRAGKEKLLILKEE